MQVSCLNGAWAVFISETRKHTQPNQDSNLRRLKTSETNNLNFMKVRNKFSFLKLKNFNVEELFQFSILSDLSQFNFFLLFQKWWWIGNFRWFFWQRNLLHAKKWNWKLFQPLVQLQPSKVISQYLALDVTALHLWNPLLSNRWVQSQSKYCPLTNQ